MHLGYYNNIKKTKEFKMDRFEEPTYYEEVCQMCHGADCEPVELEDCEWDTIMSCEVKHV